jgi:hypothetical protein
MAERVKLKGTGAGASHSAWTDVAGRLVVQWYDFGADGPYESANLIRFDQAGQRALALALGAQAPLPEALAARFPTWFAVKAFALENGIEFESEVDFQP